MDKIGVSGDETVELEDVATGVSGLRIVFVNVFAVEGPRGWTLIDAALTGSAARITHWAQEHVSRNLPKRLC